MQAITKPKQVTAIATLCLVDGVLNIAYGLIAIIAIFAGNLPGILIGPYCLTLGALEVRYAVNLFSDPIKITKPAQYIPIMQIVSLLSFNIFTLIIGSPIIGIIILFLHNSQEIKNYFQWHLSLTPEQQVENAIRSEMPAATSNTPASKVSILAIVSFITGLLAWIPIPLVNAVLDLIAIVTGISAVDEVKNGNGLVKGKVFAHLGIVLGAVNLVVFSCVLFGTIIAGLFSGGSLAIAIIELVTSILDTINNFVPRFLPPPSTPTPTSWLIWFVSY